MRLLLGLVGSVAVAGVALGVVTACGGNAFVAGPPDASAIEDSGVPSFCAIEGGAATYCYDFDESTSLGKWTAIDQTTGSSVQVVKDPSAPSQPNSLESLVPTSVAFTLAQKARVEQSLGSASAITITFQVHLDQVEAKPDTGGTSFILVQLGENTLGISANNSQISYFEDVIADGGDTGLLAGNLTATQPVLGTWVPVTLEIDIKNATMTASIDDSSSGVVPVTIAAGATPGLFLGVQSRSVAGPVEAHYDNVLINVTP